jgi:DNA polymerase III subunit epsilon
MAQTPLFLDFEASSLASDSWPIELGMAWVDAQGTVQSTGCLIQPDASWPQEAWWPSSQAVHGIARGALDTEGVPCTQAAELFLDHIAGRVAISDNPGFEARWLQRLLEAAQARPKGIIQIADMDAFFGQTLQSAGLDRAWEYLERHRTPHRAEADARRMANAWVAGLAQDRSGQPARP